MNDWPLTLAALLAGLLAATLWRSGLWQSFVARTRLLFARGHLGEAYGVDPAAVVRDIPLRPADWNGPEAAERLIDRQPELEKLLESLGFSNALERKLKGILNQLRAMTRVEIPDPEAFFDALERVENQLEETPDVEPEALRRERVEKQKDPLLRAVLAQNQDLDGILQLLCEDPIDALLPFIEEIPFHRDGEVIWRTPIDLKVVRKTPADTARFASLLGEVQHHVETTPIERSAKVMDDLLDAIARARRAAMRPDVYLPTVLHGLEADVADWLAAVPVHALEKRRRLLGVLERMLEIRARYGLRSALDIPALDGDALRDFKRSMQSTAQSYLSEPWMQGPWLTAFLLASLLASELAGLPARPSDESPRAALERIQDEVASGLYDHEETIARLHRLEERGLAVHSLIYGLLRAQEPEAAPPQGRRDWPRRARALR